MRLVENSLDTEIFTLRRISKSVFVASTTIVNEVYAAVTLSVEVVIQCRKAFRTSNTRIRFLITSLDCKRKLINVCPRNE